MNKIKIKIILVPVFFIILIFTFIGCSENNPREISYDSSSDTASNSGFGPSDESQVFKPEFRPIEAGQLRKIDNPSGDENDIDIWHLNFRGFESGQTSEVFLEAAYSPDSELMYMRLLYSGAESVIECDTDRTDIFIDLVNYIAGEQYVFMDGSEFAFGIPGMFHYPENANETFTLSYNENYIIARGTVPGKSTPEIEHVMDIIKTEMLELVISGDCD